MEIPLHKCTVEDLVVGQDETGIINNACFKLIVKEDNGKITSSILKATSPQEKLNWLNDLQDTINKCTN